MRARQPQLWLAWLGWLGGGQHVPMLWLDARGCAAHTELGYGWDAQSACAPWPLAPNPTPPAADTALVCCLLVIYTDLLEWNALGGAFGMV